MPHSLQFLSAGILWITALSPLLAQAPPPSRMVIARNVVCRAEPSVAAAGIATFRLGDQLHIEGSQAVAGTSWYLAVGKTPAAPRLDPSSMRGKCWVYGPLTAAYSDANPEPALLAAADHVLGREDASFEDAVAVENLLGWEPLSRAVDASGMLQLRKLQLVDRAASRLPDPREPLTQAWILSHRGLLNRSPFGPFWFVRPDVFWALAETHKGTPVEDDISWAAAEAAIPSDECFTGCMLELLTRTVMRYWEAFPNGRTVAEALSRASARADTASRFCVLVATGRIDPDPILPLTLQLRDSLGPVSDAGKVALLDHLSRIDQECVLDPVTSLDDPRAIPRLVRAIPTGFSAVRTALASFGEQAAPAVLTVVTSPKSHYTEAAEGLRILGAMVEGSPQRPLSTSTMQSIRAAVKQRLTEHQQMFTPIWEAIEVAALFEDADLRRLLESLASDTDAVAALGVEMPDLIERTQRRAADALARSPIVR